MVTPHCAGTLCEDAVQSLGLEGFFFLLSPFSVSCNLSLGCSSNISSVLVHSLGNSKAAAHVAVDLQCWFTVKDVKNNFWSILCDL